MEKVRTVSDTKRDFYQHHTRPINSIYRRVIEELIVEMHLLSVNIDFRPDPIYYLGVCTSFDRFMAGYTPETDIDSIFKALCSSVGGDARQYRQQARALLDLAAQKSPEAMIAWLRAPQPESGVESLVEPLKNIAGNPQFKYSRLFAIGLYTLFEQNSSELLKEEKTREELLDRVTRQLNLPKEKIQKDLELYRSNLEKMKQMLTVLQETLEASRKKEKKND